MVQKIKKPVIKSPELKRKLVIGGTVLALALASVFTYQYTTSYHATSKASKLLEEFKTAKALKILLKARKKSNKNNKVNFLIIYAYSKTKQYDLVSEELDNIRALPKNGGVKKFLKYLNTNNKVDLLIKALGKARKVDLDQETLLKWSKQRNSISDELKFLEASLSYLKNKYPKDNGSRSNSLENNLLVRYLDAADIYQGNQDYKKALDYLLRAKKLDVLDNSHLQDDYYLSLGLTYRNLHMRSEAYANLQRSAQLGNPIAQDMIDQISKRYVAPKTKKPKKSELIKIEELDESSELEASAT